MQTPPTPLRIAIIFMKDAYSAESNEKSILHAVHLILYAIPHPQCSNVHTQKCFLNLVKKPNLDCNYSFPIDLAPNGFPFGAKSVKNYIHNPNLV